MEPICAGMSSEQRDKRKTLAENQGRAASLKVSPSAQCIRQDGLLHSEQVEHAVPPTMAKAQPFVAEHLLNNTLQMGCFGANEAFVRLTRQTKIGLCEQVRVN